MREPVISVSVDTRKATQLFTGLETNIPKHIDLTTKEIAGIYAKSYIDYARIAGEKGISNWTGRSFALLRRQIKNPIRLGKGEYGVAMSMNLGALDSLRQPFYLPIKKGTSIARWAKTKLGKTGGWIAIERKPFINRANAHSRQFIKKLAQKNMRNAVKRSKK